jgi:hypothetical protein
LSALEDHIAEQDAKIKQLTEDIQGCGWKQKQLIAAILRVDPTFDITRCMWTHERAKEREEMP